MDWFVVHDIIQHVRYRSDVQPPRRAKCWSRTRWRIAGSVDAAIVGKQQRNRLILVVVWIKIAFYEKKTAGATKVIDSIFFKRQQKSQTMTKSTTV